MISVQNLIRWLPHGGRSHRAKTFADAAFPDCAGHGAEALATLQVLERLVGHRLDHVELDAPLSQVLPDRSRPAHHREVKEEIWATTVCHALLGPTARATTWDGSTIWARSLRGIINERMRSAADCSCGRRESRRTMG